MARTSTLPSALLRTQPAMPRMCASRSTNQRKPTPCTRPRTRKRRARTAFSVDVIVPVRTPSCLGVDAPSLDQYLCQSDRKKNKRYYHYLLGDIRMAALLDRQR